MISSILTLIDLYFILHPISLAKQPSKTMAHVSHSLSPIPPHLASIPVSPEFGDALKEAYARHDVQRSLSPVSPVSSSESSRTPTPTPFAKRNTPLLPYLQSSSSPSYSSSAADHRMKPRVAVRDKTPHRFQVVPLREAPRNMPPAATAIAPVGATPWSRLNVNLRNVECGGTFVRLFSFCYISQVRHS